MRDGLVKAIAKLFLLIGTARRGGAVKGLFHAGGHHQFGDRLAARQDEKLLVHAARQPAKSGDDKDKPVISSQLVPPFLVGRGSGWGGEVVGRHGSSDGRAGSFWLAVPDITGRTPRGQHEPRFQGAVPCPRCRESASSER